MRAMKTFFIKDSLGESNALNIEATSIARAICSRFQRRSIEVYLVDDFGFKYIVDMITIHKSGDWEIAVSDSFAFDSKHEMLRFVARNTGCYKNIQAMIDGYGLSGMGNSEPCGILSLVN